MHADGPEACERDGHQHRQQPHADRFDFNTDRIRLDGSQVAQTLESGGTRQHSLVTLKQDVPNTAISVVQISDPREPVAGDITKEQILVGLSC